VVPPAFAGQLTDEHAFDASFFHRRIIARRDLNRIFTRRAFDGRESGIGEGSFEIRGFVEPFLPGTIV
jgi:hypothetical protein